MPRKAGKNNDRTALLIYCTREEAEQIKVAAKRERRTITGFVLNAVMSRMAVMRTVRAKMEAQVRPENLERQAEEPGDADRS